MMNKLKEDRMEAQIEQEAIKLSLETAGKFYARAQDALKATGALDVEGQWNDPLYWGQMLMMVVLEEMRGTSDSGALPDVIAHNVSAMIRATSKGDSLYKIASPEHGTMQ